MHGAVARLRVTTSHRAVASVLAGLAFACAVLILVRSDSPSVQPVPRDASRNGDPSSRAGENEWQRPDPVGFADQETWLGRLQSRAEVSFVRESVPGVPGDVLERLASLGPLEGKDLDVAKAFAHSLLTGAQDALVSHRRSMSLTSLRDAYREADLLMDVEVALAVQECLRAGGYLVLPTQQRVPAVAGTVKFEMGVMANGQQANAVFVLSLSDLPSLAMAHSYRYSVEQALVDERILSFNLKELSERKAMIERNDSIMTMSNPSSGDIAFQRQWFPVGVIADREAWILVRRPS